MSLIHSIHPALVRLARVVVVVGLVVIALPMAFMASAQARSPAKPSPAIYTRSIAPFKGAGLDLGLLWKTDLTIRKNGKVTGRDGRHLATLTPSDLRVLDRELRKTRFITEQTKGVQCEAFPTRMTRIQTSYGEVAWAAPCSDPPHVSVLMLELLVTELVSRRNASPIPLPELSP